MNAPWPSRRKHRGPLENGENTRYFASRMVLVLITPFAVIAYYFLFLYLGYLLDTFLHGAKSAMSMNTDLAPFWLSLRVAGLATLAIALVGTPTALALARLRFPGKGLVAGALVLPLVLPPTVLGYDLLLILGRRAPLGAWLERAFGVTIVFHWTGAVVASAVAAFPLFLLPARAAFEGVDPALEDVARLLGRREWSVFLGVTLPLAWRGLATGTVLAFARALGDFGASMMVAGDIPGLTQTASMAIFDASNAGDMATAGTLTLLISVVAIAALWTVQQIQPDRRTRRT